MIKKFPNFLLAVLVTLVVLLPGRTNLILADSPTIVAPPCEFWNYWINRAPTISEVNQNRDHWSHTDGGDNLQDTGRSVDLVATGRAAVGQNGQARPFMSCKTDKKAYASISGTLRHATGYGTTIIIENTSGIKVLYGHMDQILVPNNTWVNVGDYIGVIGKTGYASVDHIHFNVYRNGIRLTYNSNYSSLANQWEFGNIGQSTTSAIQRADDWNGDGKDEILKIWKENNSLYADAHLSNGSGLYLQRYATALGGFPTDQLKFVKADFTGDGRTDVAKIWRENNQITIDVHPSRPANGTYPDRLGHERWATAQGGFPTDQIQFLTGDFNGDNKDDILKIWRENNSLYSDAHLSNGAGFSLNRFATAQGGYPTDQLQFFVGDFNGDGKDDLAKIWRENGQFYSDVHVSTGIGFSINRFATAQGGFPTDQIRFLKADVNGDNKDDIVKIWRENGQLYSDAHISSGTGFSLNRFATAQGGFPTDQINFGVGDFDGDGKDDIVKIWKENNQFYSDVHSSNGSAFIHSRFATAQGGFPTDQLRFFIGDFNNDGKDELVKLWRENNQLTVDAHISTGTAFVHQRWATNQGGLPTDQLTVL